MRRRTLIGSLATLTTGGVVLATQSESSTALSASTDGIHIPDKESKQADSVSSLKLTLNGTIAWDGTSKPTRGVVRLRVRNDSQTTQLAAKSLSSPFSAAEQRDYSFSKVNLLSHPQIEASELTPAKVDNSKSIEITIILKIELYRNGTPLAETKLTDNATISVTKTVGSAELTVDGDGSITVD